MRGRDGVDDGEMGRRERGEVMVNKRGMGRVKEMRDWEWLGKGLFGDMAEQTK